MGQARKSLWIETYPSAGGLTMYEGQARKSLWIETVKLLFRTYTVRVRLVRACGSKPKNQIKIGGQVYGQARKSLWIETKKDLRSRK